LKSDYLTDIELTTTQTFLLNTWTHFTVTFSVNTVKIYANGKLMESVSYDNPLNKFFSALSLNGEIGRSLFSNNDYFTGDFDDFKMFAGTLNNGECEAVFNAVNRCSFKDCKPVVTINQPLVEPTEIQAAELVSMNQRANANASLFSARAIELLPGFETAFPLFRAEIWACPVE
jgi:hypothetical protein